MAPTQNPKSMRSRFSSPLHLSSLPTGHNRGVAGSDGQRNFMQRWLEPPIQNKASYQEAGLVRTGVVENMAPLGTLPKGNMLKKPAQRQGSEDHTTESVDEPAAPVIPKTRIVLKKKSAAAPVAETIVSVAPASTTPSELSPTPTPLSNGGSMSPQLGVEMDIDMDDVPASPSTRPMFRPQATSQHDGPDEEYAPRKARPRRQSAQKNASAVSSRKSSPTASSGPKLRQRSERLSVSSRAPSVAQDHEPKARELVDKVVEIAVGQALEHHRYPTAWALRDLYDKNSSDPQFVSMFEDVYSQAADDETLQEFQRLVEGKKREGKKNNKSYDYFVPREAAGSRPTPTKPIPGPYGHLIRDKSSADEATPTPSGRASKKIKLDDGRAADSMPTSPSGEVANKTPSKSPHKMKRKTPKSARKQRSGSISSTSSLSSVPDDAPEDFDEYMDTVEVRNSEWRCPSAHPNDVPKLAEQAQPINATQHQKPAASTRKDASPGAPNTALSTQHTTAQSSPAPTTTAQESSMPGLVLAHGAPPTKTAGKKLSGKLGDADAPSNGLLEKKIGKKAETRSLTRLSSQDSFVRAALGADEDVFQATPAPARTPGQTATEQSRLRARTPATTARTTRAAKRNHDELDDPVSPTSLTARPDHLDPPSTRGSRAATPSNLRSAAAKKPKGARTKTSPMKKPRGPSAGIPRPVGDRPSPFGGHDNQHDNDDTCFTCSGNGQVVCCDGCRYSFHPMCIDPPVENIDLVDDQYFCKECVARRSPIGEKKGVFGSLISNLYRKNPRSYRLPGNIRDRFEGVRTGEDGEYEDIVTAAPKPKPGKKGYEEPFDFFRVKNPDGTPALCHRCNGVTRGDRLLLPCSVCGLNWHLDCMDPPLTAPPLPRTFRCPAHVDDILTGLAAKLAPAHRTRKVKNAPVIEQSYTRGLANNGIIEIEEDSDDEVVFGRTYRVSEKGIKQDFLSRVRQNQRGSRDRSTVPNPALPTALQPQARSLEDQQAALNLAQLHRGDCDGATQLIQALLSQSSPQMVSYMAIADADRLAANNLSQSDNAALQAMRAQAEILTKNITNILEGRGQSTTQDSMPTVATPASMVEKQVPVSDAGLNDTFALDSSATQASDGPQSSASKSSELNEDAAMQID